MSAFLSGIWAKLLAGLAIVGGILLAIGKLKQAGRDAERSDQAKQADKIRREANEARSSVDGAGDAELDRVRRRWTTPE
jgi:hypothetical protein